MARTGTPNGRLGLVLLVLFAFLTAIFLPGFASKARNELNGDALATTIIGRRNAFAQLKASPNNNSTNLLGVRAPGFKPTPSAPDDAWEKATKKGQLLRCYMKDPSSAGDLGRGKWNDYNSLQEWGWRETTTQQIGGERDPGLKQIVALDPDDWSNQNKIVKFEHVNQHPDQVVTGSDGGRVTVSHPPTGATYENTIYPGNGVIIAESNWNPKFNIDEGSTSKGDDWDPSTMRQPDLFQMSDIWWLTWQKYATPAQRPGLRAVVKHNIVNEPTKQIIARALRLHWPDEELPGIGSAPAWPGKTFTPDMEGFAPILGINSIWGVPFFLIQHHGDDELGRLEVKKITVWRESMLPTFYQPNAYVEIGPVEGSA